MEGGRGGGGGGGLIFGTGEYLFLDNRLHRKISALR